MKLQRAKVAKVAELNINVNKHTLAHSHDPKNFGLLLSNNEEDVKANAK